MNTSFKRKRSGQNNVVSSPVPPTKPKPRGTIWPFAIVLASIAAFWVFYRSGAETKLQQTRQSGKECGNDVSTTATACTKSGNVDLGGHQNNVVSSPVPPTKPKPRGTIWPFAIVLASIAAFWVFYRSGETRLQQTRQPEQANAAPAKEPESDVDILFRIGNAARATKVVQDFELHTWSSQIDFHIGSMLVSDAQWVSYGICDAALKQPSRLQRPWTVRVFLIMGEWPAAMCTIK